MDHHHCGSELRHCRPTAGARTLTVFFPRLCEQLIAFEISLVLIREGLPFLNSKEEKDSNQ